MTRVVVILFLFFTSPGIAQIKKFSSLSKYEKCWAFFHPFAACKIKKHQKEMYAVYEDVKKNNLLDQFANGGKLDAFRHTFAMAYFSKFVSVKKLRKLGNAHEKGNYLDFKKGRLEDGELPDSLSSVMDLNNNELGFLLRKSLKNFSTEELKNKVLEQINAGAAYTIKRNKEGNYVDCDGNIILAEDLRSKWGNKKCLVQSSR